MVRIEPFQTNGLRKAFANNYLPGVSFYARCCNEACMLERSANARANSNDW